MYWIGLTGTDPTEEEVDPSHRPDLGFISLALCLKVFGLPIEDIGVFWAR